MNINERIEDVSTSANVGEVDIVTTPETHTTKSHIEENLQQKKQPEDISKEDHTEGAVKLTRSLRHSTTSSEANEEVDDIELIFSSDDKEHLQEDLVSISDFEPWEKAGSTGTPVLVNFGTLSSSEDLVSKSKKKESGEMNMETDQEGIENRTDMRRDESVDTFEQVHDDNFFVRQS